MKRREEKRREIKGRKEKRKNYLGEERREPYRIKKSRIARIIRNKADHTVKCVFDIFLSSL